MMIRSRTPSCSAGGMAGLPLVVTAGPGVGWGPVGDCAVTGGTTLMVGAAFPVSARPDGCRRGRDGLPGSAGGVRHDLGDVRGEAVGAVDQTGDPDQDEASRDRLVEAEVGGVLDRSGAHGGKGVRRVRGLVAGADLQ